MLALRLLWSELVKLDLSQSAICNLPMSRNGRTLPACWILVDVVFSAGSGEVTACLL